MEEYARMIYVRAYAISKPEIFITYLGNVWLCKKYGNIFIDSHTPRLSLLYVVC